MPEPINAMERSSSPFFSVVLPTYNRAAWLQGAIDSLLQQTWTSWELIVVDDGSTDHTADVVKANTDPRICYHFQENAERSAARNKGMQLARGAFICFLDSDDRYDPEHLAQLEKGIRRHGDGLYVSRAQLVDAQGTPCGEKALELKGHPVETILFNAIGTSQICIPRSQAFGSDDGTLAFDPQLRINEDTDFLVRALAVLELVVLSRPTVVYTIHPENSVALGGKHNVYKDRMRSLEKLLELDACRDLSSVQKTVLLSDCYFGMAKHHALRRDFGRARWTMVLAALRFPGSRLKEKVYAALHPSSMVPQANLS